MIAAAGAAHAQTAPAIGAGGAISNILDGAAPGTVTVGGITVYGTIDVGMVYNSHGANRDVIGSNYIGAPYLIQNSSQRSNFTYQNNALSQSNVGIKGAQSIGDLIGVDGLRAWQIGFLAQMDFDPLYGQVGDILKAEARNNGLPNNQRSFAADGSRAGQIFNNQAYVSLKNTVLGEVRFGRNNTTLLDLVSAYEPQGGSYALSPLGFSGTIGGGAGVTEDTRWNNSLKYNNTIGPVRIAGMYRFEGGGQGGDGFGLGVGIDAPGALKGFSIDGNYTKENSAVSTSILSSAQCTAGFGANNLAACQSSNVLGGTIQDTETWTVAAKYKFQDDTFLKGATIMGGYEQITNSNASGRLDNLNTIGGYQLLNVSGNNVPNYTAFGTNRQLDIFWIGARYAFTPKLSGAAAYYLQHQNAYVASNATGGLTPCSGVGVGSKGNCGGDLNLYSLSLDYQLTKRLDLYAGASWTDVSGGLSGGLLVTNDYNLVSGIRFRF